LIEVNITFNGHPILEDKKRAETFAQKNNRGLKVPPLERRFGLFQDDYSRRDDGLTRSG
jgi:hypothetical protein